MFAGDIGATALLAKSDALETAKMSLFQPFAFMLAQPEEDPAEIVAALGKDALADDKYDGIRAQIHTDGNEVRIYSRTLDNVTHRFPELEAAAKELGHSAILDGEIVAFKNQILPFAIIQKRLGRRQVSAKLLADAPVVFFAFDLLYLDGEPLFELPLRERLHTRPSRQVVAEVQEGGWPHSTASSPTRSTATVGEVARGDREDPSSAFGVLRRRARRHGRRRGWGVEVLVRM